VEACEKDWKIAQCNSQGYKCKRCAAISVQIDVLVIILQDFDCGLRVKAAERIKARCKGRTRAYAV
jgi:hypothetical protein